MLYPVVLTPYAHGFCVRFPDIPEALTVGSDQDDALRHAADAGESALEFYYERGESIPVPSMPLPGDFLVYLATASNT